MTDRDFWEQIYRRFEPEKPPRDPSWRVERHYSPAGKILADLRRPFGGKRYLVYGTVGSGKTTELLWLSRQRAQDSFVIFVDLYAHFQEKLGDPDALQN